MESAETTNFFPLQVHINRYELRDEGFEEETRDSMSSLNPRSSGSFEKGK